MANPWTKKNPLLSMWLSGVNAVLGATRAHTVAAAKRQASTAVVIATREITKAMRGSASAFSAKPTRKSKRKKRLA